MFDLAVQNLFYLFAYYGISVPDFSRFVKFYYSAIPR